MKKYAMLCLLGLMVALGCDQKPSSSAPESKTDKKAKQEANPEEVDNPHEGWWCEEHGIPESECSMCSKKAGKACKDKGDWCDKHNRAKSQCFICDPSLMEKFAAKYEAKYGKKPPEPYDNMPEKKEPEKKEPEKKEPEKKDSK